MYLPHPPETLSYLYDQRYCVTDRHHHVLSTQAKITMFNTYNGLYTNKDEHLFLFLFYF